MDTKPENEHLGASVRPGQLPDVACMAASCAARYITRGYTIQVVSGRQLQVTAVGDPVTEVQLVITEDDECREYGPLKSTLKLDPDEAKALGWALQSVATMPDAQISMD